MQFTFLWSLVAVTSTKDGKEKSMSKLSLNPQNQVCLRHLSCQFHSWDGFRGHNFRDFPQHRYMPSGVLYLEPASFSLKCCVHPKLCSAYLNFKIDEQFKEFYGCIFALILCDQRYKNIIHYELQERLCPQLQAVTKKWTLIAEFCCQLNFNKTKLLMLKRILKISVHYYISQLVRTL